MRFMVEKFEFKEVNFYKMFSKEKVRYKIPSYQRGFTWTYKKEGSRLWDDIDACLDNPGMNVFLGTIVLDEEDNSIWSDRIISVVDGQQRITTLFALIWALLRVAEKRSLDTDNSILRGLLSIRSEEENITYFKPKLMPEVRDRNTFNVRMREADAFWNKQNKKTQQCFYKPIDTSNTEENKKLSQMFNYHYRQIETRIKQKETEYGESWTGDQEKSVYEEILAIATRRLTLVTLEPPEALIC